MVEVLSPIEVIVLGGIGEDREGALLMAMAQTPSSASSMRGSLRRLLDRHGAPREGKSRYKQPTTCR